MRLRHIVVPDELPEGERRDERRRREDRWRIRLNRFWVAAITIIVLWAALTAKSQIADLKHESKLRAQETAKRVNETCTINENKQLRDVLNLEKLYDYVLHLSKKDLRSSLNKAVVAGIPQAESDAETDDAPSYCDKPGVEAEAHGADPIGLPEPDHKIPPRPKKIDRLIKGG